MAQSGTPVIGLKQCACAYVDADVCRNDAILNQRRARTEEFCYVLWLILARSSPDSTRYCSYQGVALFRISHVNQRIRNDATVPLKRPTPLPNFNQNRQLDILSSKIFPSEIIQQSRRSFLH